jgi:hypothetical protein
MQMKREGKQKASALSVFSERFDPKSFLFVIY